MIVGFEFHPLQIENDVGYVLDNAWERGELMLGTRDLYGGDSRALQRGKQDTPE
jgi:hypothetical protein